jgi:hypothetical protein
MSCLYQVLTQRVDAWRAANHPYEQRLDLRQPVDGDDEFALAAVGLVLRDLGWAS